MCVTYTVKNYALEKVWSMFEQYLPSLFVNQEEDCVEFGVPGEAIADAFPCQLTCGNFQQIHLDGLLNEHHVALRHCYNELRLLY